MHLYIPPPLAGPHIIKLFILIVFIKEHSLRFESHMISECRVPDQLLYTFDRIPAPKFDFFDHLRFTACVPNIYLVSCDLEDLTCPSRNIG